MNVPVLANQQELNNNNSVQTCREWWMIGMNGERESEESVVAAWLHDDDDILVFTLVWQVGFFYSGNDNYYFIDSLAQNKQFTNEKQIKWWKEQADNIRQTVIKEQDVLSPLLFAIASNLGQTTRPSDSVEKRKISYFGLACNLIQHWISPNQDDLSYSARTFISG